MEKKKMLVMMTIKFTQVVYNPHRNPYIAETIAKLKSLLRSTMHEIGIVVVLFLLECIHLHTFEYDETYPLFFSSSICCLVANNVFNVCRLLILVIHLIRLIK